MVQNLNVLSFAPYGNLLAERSDGAAMPKGAHWEERILSVTAQETYQYCPKESVYLDYQSGMSILAVAKEQEMKAAAQEQRAKVIEAEAEVPRAMAAALREGKLGVMDYYEMKNTIADTAMRDSIASMGEGANAPRKK